MGELSALTPLSEKFGYDRGGPVDRVYIEEFLATHQYLITGRVLEIADNQYTTKFGGTRVTRSDVLHFEQGNQNATITGDLADFPHDWDGCFDTIILTQTLHLIYDFKKALLTCRRLLKPGGTLLLTVPGITNIDHGEWGNKFYYTFTTHVFSLIGKDLFPNDEISAHNYGNVKSATAFLYGLGKNEIPPATYRHHDPHYQLIVAVKMTRCLKG